MKIPIVNEYDEVIEYKDKKDLTDNDINRDTGLWILDENDSILLAQRSANKKLYPNLWTAAVAGTVEEGETYESNIIKEAEEEIGLKDIKPTYLYTRYRSSGHKRMTGIFLLKILNSTKFKIEEKEISNIKWFSKDEIDNLLINKREMFTPGFPDDYKKFIEYENKN